MRIDVSFLLIVAGVFDIAGPLLANGQYYHYLGDKNFTTCFYDKFKDYSGASPTSRSQTCDSASPFVTNSSECLYFYLRSSFSKLYDTFPYNIFFPRAPDIGNLPILNASADTYNYTPATSEEMVQGTKAVQLFLQCGQPFSVLCGGHSNAGASIVLGKRVLSVRHLNAVNTTLKADAVFDDEFDGSEILGSSFVGAGSTAGRATALTYEGKYFAALPVGQKPSVGMSGLTLGGGFGFLTRFSGLLCDRLISLTAIVPTTPEGKPVKVTKNNEYSDLFWASCGGGGGNFAVVTEFEFNPVQVCRRRRDEGNDSKCRVIKLDLILPVSEDVVRYYQEWSMRMSTRITPNLEVQNSTHVKIAGVFLGDETLWEEAVRQSGANETTPISSTDLLAKAESTEFTQALTDLTGWTPNDNPDALLRPFLEERTFFKYKSFWLFEPLPDEVIRTLIKEAMHFAEGGSAFVVFEYQALGGDPGAPADGSDVKYPYLSPKNLFSTVRPKDTAFPHRGARHCLMLKAQASDELLGNRLVLLMERIYSQIGGFVQGNASYYNHNDPNLEHETPYFKNGIELNPGVTADDKDYWLDRFREIRAKYNPLGLMVNPMGVGMPILDEKSSGSSSSGSSATGSVFRVLLFLSVGHSIWLLSLL